MAMQVGEIYRCSNSDCGCEIEVLKGPQHAGHNEEAPRCCCGLPMESIEEVEEQHVAPR